MAVKFQSGKNFKWDASWTMPVFMLIGVGILVWFLSDMFSGLSDTSLNDEEKKKLEDIKSIPVDEDNLSITVNQAAQRANNLHTAMKGAGTDELAIVKNLIKQEFQNMVTYPTGGISAVSLVFGFDPVTGDTQSYKEKYKQYESTIKLSNDDLNLITREFGVKDGTNMSAGLVGYYTLSEWINTEVDGELLELVEYIFRNSDVNI